MTKNTLRCAIYTRKSTEEGLDQEFNSLDAQREACSAYVHSQRHEGWKMVSARYDDGGYSGGTLERPALQQLMSDIDGGKVDLIVVYKIDRLTRSLHDFAKIVDRLDQRKASFVSITQSFNTTTSMGRLTLNVLLSFAQFEREVTGERIRDKIAASKKKGMWMGGTVPLGYECRHRKLVINKSEAITVRRIFHLYRELGNLGSLRAKLKQENRVSKARLDRTGAHRGENDFSCGALFAILKNRTYRGEIPHKGTFYPALHEPIISAELWDAVQQTIARTGDQKISRARIRHPLHGLITDELKRRYSPTHTKKGGRRYCYYASRAEDDKQHPGSKRGRVPAEEFERVIADALAAYLRDEAAILCLFDDAVVDDDRKRTLVEQAKTLIAQELGATWTNFRTLIGQIVVRSDTIKLHLDRRRLQSTLLPEHAVTCSDDNAEVVLTIQSRLYRCGRDAPIIVGNETTERRRLDLPLLRLIARGQRWYRQLASGKRPSLRSIADEEGLSERYVSRIVAGSLLAPDVIEAALSGHATNLTVKALRTRPPADWDEQRRIFRTSLLACRADADI